MIDLKLPFPDRLLFDFSDEKTGRALSRFYEKHTGRYVDFNAIKQYKDGLRILCFHLPLGFFERIGITAATHGYPAIHIKDIQSLIDWYENEYLVMRNVGIIKHIPHSSLRLPAVYKGNERLIFGSVWERENVKLCDLFIDCLFAAIPGIELKAPYSRMYCDIEKFRDEAKEPMAKLGQGYIYTKSIFGRNFLRGFTINGIPLDGEVDSYYEEQHKRLDDATKEILSEGKDVLILDLHSFSEEQAKRMGKQGPFPDICVGVVEGFYDPKILRVILKKIEEAGFSYSINDPYEGSMIPDGVLSGTIKGKVTSIMLEVNKRLYL